MKSYEILKEICDGLFSHLQKGRDANIFFDDAVKKLSVQISNDLRSLFGRNFSLEMFHVYFDDETYRQTATGLILNFTVLDNQAFKIRVECLVDYGKIWIKVKEGKDLLDFADITNRVEMFRNSEGLSELKEIKYN